MAQVAAVAPVQSLTEELLCAPPKKNCYFSLAFWGACTWLTIIADPEFQFSGVRLSLLEKYLAVYFRSIIEMYLSLAC